MRAGNGQSGDSLTGRVIRRVLDATDEQDTKTLGMARACLTDWLGVTIAAMREPQIEDLVTDALCEGGGSHSLIGRPERLRMSDAALVHGVASHLLDYDDGLPAMSGHASVALLPALLALAGRPGVDDGRFLAALVTGAEAAGAIGLLMAPSHYARGFHATGTVGALACAMACGHLLDLDESQYAVALGLAGTRAAGLKSAFGTSAKPLHAGWAGVVGLSSACLAARGWDACTDILGAEQGFGPALADQLDVERALAPAQSGLHIHDTRFKRFASCGVTHATIDALLAMCGRGGIGAGAVSSVVVRVGAGADRICNIVQPRSGLEAKFSLRWVTAMTLLGYDLAAPATFDDAIVARAEVHTLADRIEVELVTDRAATWSEAAIHMVDGSVSVETRDGALRLTDPAALRTQIERKFLALASPVLSTRGARALLDTIYGLGSSGARPLDLLELTRQAAS